MLSIVISPILLASRVLGAAQCDAPNVEDRYPLLAQLSLPKDALPMGCSIPDHPNPPIKGLQNRRITTDSRAFIVIDDEVTKEFGKSVDAVYYAVYVEKNEIGILAWAFETPKLALDVHCVLTKKYAGRVELWRKDKYLICLWRDKGTTDKCFKHFKAFIQNKVDRFRTVLN